MHHVRFVIRPLTVFAVFLLIISLIPTHPVEAASLVVNSLDSDGDGVCDATCTLRDAIMQANALPGADTITFTVNGTITLTSDLPAITGTLTITGNGTGNTIISGNLERRILWQDSGTLTLQSLTLRDGNTTDHSGGMYAGGNLTLNNVAFINNSSFEAGALLANGPSVTINASVFDGNTATHRGGAIFFNADGSTHSIVNSLFVNNMSATYGGAINLTGGSLTITNSTISGNTSTLGAVTASNNVTTLNLRNSIVANTTGGPDCLASFGAVFNAEYSLCESDMTFVTGTTTGSLTGDPFLDSSYRLTNISPAINAGDVSFIPDTLTDLAGAPRIQQGAVDMGAYESPFMPFVPEVTISPASLTVNEGANADFTITRTGPTTNDLVVTLNITQGAGTVEADYTLSGGNISGQSGNGVTVTIPAGQASVNVNILAVDDDLDETDETVTLTLVDDAAYNLSTPDSATATITDNDTAGITVSPTSGLVTTEAGGTAQFMVVLNSQPTADVTIPLSSSDTNEGTVSQSSLIFTAANWNVPQTVTVTGVDDALVDGDVAYTIITDVAVSADTNYDGLDAADVSVTNTDDDTAGITVNPTAGLVTTEAGGTAQFMVVLNSQPTADVSIALSSSDTTEGTVSPLTLTFTPDDWNEAQMVTVTGVDDALVDGDVAYTIITDMASSADLNYNGVDPADVSVTNTDNDSAGITVNPTAGLVTTEAGGTAQFTVVLNSQPTDDVLITLSSSDTSEGTVSPSLLIFTTTNWDEPQTVIITGVNDNVVDSDVVYTIITEAAVSADATYSGLDAADVSVTNTDDDTAGIDISPIIFHMSEGTAQSYNILVGTEPSAPLTLALTFDPSQVVVNGRETSPVLLTFTSGGLVTVTVDVVENNDVNTDRVAVITHAIVSSGAAEYPTTMTLPSVTVNIGDVPPPPPVPTCEAHNFEAGGVVRSSAPDATSYAINCRVLYQNGSPTTWLGNPLYSEANLGVAGLLELGVVQAVDIFSPPGLTYFDGGAVFCLRGSGTLIWLAASGAPRHPEIIGSYTVDDFPGFTCVTLFEPGTLILVRDNPLD